MAQAGDPPKRETRATVDRRTAPYGGGASSSPSWRPDGALIEDISELYPAILLKIAGAEAYILYFSNLEYKIYWSSI